jgi:rhodanese-related sulfurtransferase
MRLVVAFALLAVAGVSRAESPPATGQAAAPAAHGAPVAAGAARGPAAASTASPVRPITADALLARQHAKDPSLVVLDVRTPEEFAEGHVPGAVNVPHDQVGARLGELQSLKDKDVVLYCRSGRRAGMAAEVLQQAGFTRLQHLEGDMQGWTAAGRPTAK